MLFLVLLVSWKLIVVLNNRLFVLVLLLGGGE